MNAFQFRQMPLFVIVTETLYGDGYVIIYQRQINWDGDSFILDIQVIKGG